MGLVMIADVVGMDKALAGIRQVKGMLNSKREVFARGALHAMADVYDRNFVSEGKATGGWAPLAEQTRNRREALGFQPDHPILVRYGDLREYTASALKTVGPSASFVGQGKGGRYIKVDVRSGNGSVNVVASGGQAQNQIGNSETNLPARPFWYINQTVRNAAKRGAVEAIHKEVLRLS